MIRKFTAIQLSALLVGLVALLPLTTSAQNTETQICVRSFEDRNADGMRDPGEPPITQGVSADLIDTSGTIIRTLLLSQSQQAASGIMCFTGVPYGSYTVDVISADYVAIGNSSFEATVSEDNPIQILGYGAQVFVPDNTLPAQAVVPDETLLPDTAADTETAAPLDTLDVNLSEAEQIALAERLFFGLTGMAVIMGGMGIVGMMLYALLLYPRLRRLSAYQAQATGMMAAQGGGTQSVQAAGTQSMPAGIQKPATPPAEQAQKPKKDNDKKDNKKKKNKQRGRNKKPDTSSSRTSAMYQIEETNGIPAGTGPLDPPPKPDEDTGPLQPLS